MRSWRWYLSRVMRLFLSWFRLCPHRGRRKRQSRVRDLWNYGKVILKSLYYNILTNSDTLLDCAFEPIYWVVDNLTRWFGVVFVSLVISLTSSVVIIVYVCMLPVILNTYPLHWILWHLCYGHWNLLMVVFHYYKATTTHPGAPPQEKSDIPTVTICKKCIIPKPARTHHCSICSSTVTFALGALTLWHAVLISRGETSVERHINRKERKRLKLKGKSLANTSAATLQSSSSWGRPDVGLS
ncbi:Palmitoyltransferase ZDHHC16B [Triplophysa tibetana]|uniref:Palmitoyltransferase ZDHHC16B n=1 Tax=Triplophysa tibetana TaxID=1572043 RepID=A0A5A9PUA7_9TELE|nr:Palmitoyltransferase ZDHHC16B [Triplophysa tibetana]